MQSAFARAGWAGSLPDPWLKGMVQNISFEQLTIGEKMNGMSMAGVELSQMFPAGSKRRAERTVAEKQAMLKTSMLRRAEVTELADVRKSLVSLNRIDRIAAVILLMRSNYRQIEEALNKSYAVGVARQASIFRIQTEITRLTDLLATLERSRAAVEARIRERTGLNEGERIGRFPLPPDLLDRARRVRSVLQPYGLLNDSWIDTAPDLWVAQARIAEAEARLARAKSEYKSDWMVSGGVFSRGDLDPLWRVGVGVSLPVRTASRQDPIVEEAEKRLDAARANAREARARVRRRLEDLAVAIDQSAFQVDLIHTTLLPQARLAFEATLAQYRVGSADFENLIQTLLRLEKIEIQQIETECRLAALLVDLDELRGWLVAPERATRNPQTKGLEENPDL
ncbi:MAG: TolC family protein [Candidatus Hydrogenedentota bacterium]|nr:MAG: TolC family protein [Candidatus Hydrogenedentota bacterium]